MESFVYEDKHLGPINDAYDGKCILVTGSSGFLGKVFVEKLLYRCPKIAKVYVLMRDTERDSAKEKLKKMLDCPLFKRLKEERPQDLEKIIPITGDISKPKLGMSAEEENILINNVSLVFHFAATVKFNDPLHVHLNTNVEGTRRMLDLCARITNLQLFLYVSTAFSNGDREVIDEVVYPSVIPLSELEQLTNQQTFTTEQMQRILNGLPNTYTLSKNLAENLVAEYHEKHRFPTVIVRPSIVISCKDEPMSGWIDNWFGPTALAVAIGRGVIRLMCCDGDNTIDLIPVDYVANLVIITGARCRRTENVEVYNSCSSATNPITLRKLTDLIIQDSQKRKHNFVPLPRLLYIKWRWIMIMLTFLLEFLPALILDCALRIIGKKNKHLKMLSKVQGVRSALEPFTSRTWMMKSNNTSALAETLSANDRHVFACDATTLNWDEFIPIYLEGVQKYLINNKK